MKMLAAVKAKKLTMKSYKANFKVLKRTIRKRALKGEFVLRWEEEKNGRLAPPCNAKDVAEFLESYGYEVSYDASYGSYNYFIIRW